jgi:hypothetical protein
MVVGPGVFGDFILPFGAEQFQQVFPPPGPDQQKGLVFPVPNH